VAPFVPLLSLLLSLAVTREWSLRSFDIQNFFLHGVLEEEVYMHHPLGFVDQDCSEHLCCLVKYLYCMNPRHVVLVLSLL
jgi:hypothetical protein